MSIQAQNTELNIVPGGIIPVVHVSQYDVDRVLTFNLYDRNSEASLASGTTAVIEGTKPDGNGFQYAATISGNTVTVNTTIQMTVLSGTVDCKIVLRNGSQVIGTALFIMDVEKAGINENTPMSETDLPLIISEATEQMERAEAAATAAALSEENAEAEALKAEGYATGKQNGEEVSSESLYYHNNAEYYSEYAESIAESLPDGLNIKGTCTFAELPSIADSFVGDTWVISDSFTTTSDFRGGSGVPVAAGAYVYLTDSNKWDILPSKSSGHIIIDSDGVTMPQRANLKFVNCNVTDDPTNDMTIVEAEGGGGSTLTATLSFTTNNSAFYGQTITVKDGNETTLTTTTFSNQGTATATLIGSAGYYYASVVAYGVTKTEQIALTESGEYNVALNSPAILGAWIDKGGLDYTDYADFSEVEADEEAVRRLMTIHASVDYLAECGSATDSLVLSIINSDICAKWINLRDYALDTLYANTYLKAMMDTADKYFYGEWVITDSTTNPVTWGAKGNVPIMTANDAPYGVASADSEYSSTYAAWKAFDGDSSTRWASTTGSKYSGYCRYKFTNPTCVKRTMVFNEGSNATTLQVEGSNDGVNFTPISSSVTVQGTESISIDCNNSDYYLYYQVAYQQANGDGATFRSLQFYGRELRESVPVMTSNTAPYGVVSGISEYSSDYAKWKAFNPSESKGWATAAGTGGQGNHPWIKYEFPAPVNIIMAFGKGVGTHASEWSTWKLEGSNDDTNYTELLSELKIYYGSSWSNASFNNINSYKYYRLTGVDTSTSFSKDDGNKFQFYGLNYSEYDWDADYPRHYLYDHGIELETIESIPNGSVYVKEDDHILVTEHGVYVPINDLSPYVLIRQHMDKEYVAQNAGSINVYDINGTAVIAYNKYQGQEGNFPNNLFMDISSIQTAGQVRTYISSPGKVSFNEWWLE